MHGKGGGTTAKNGAATRGKGKRRRSKRAEAEAEAELTGYLEIDIDVHNFSYLARQGLYGLLDRLPLMHLELAFLVEATGPDELPEQVLGAFELRGLDLRALAAAAGAGGSP